MEKSIFIPVEYLVTEDWDLTIAMLVIMMCLYLMVFGLMGFGRMKSAGALALFTLSVNWWLVESTLISGY